MKKWALMIMGTLFLSAAFAQEKELPLYKRFPTVPPFSIIKLPDSTRFVKDQLNKKTAVMVIVFSPDCDHCQMATRDLLANIALFKKVQIVMASNVPYAYIHKFYEEYGIAKVPNIVMGWDAGYFFGTFYSIHNFPSIFLYDKKGNFVKEFEGSVPFKQIAASL